MASLVEYDLGNELTLCLESSGSLEPVRAGKVMRGGVRDVVTDATKSFDEAIAQVGPAAAKMVETLKAASPSEIALEFGIKLEAKAGAIITMAGGEAHFKVSLKWKA